MIDCSTVALLTVVRLFTVYRLYHLPLAALYRLLPLVTTTLNLLRPSRINPKWSAHEVLEGALDALAAISGNIL